MAVDLPIVGQVNLPRPEELAYYVGLAVLAAAEIIDWPVALVLAVGHALNYSHHSRVANELGDALDEIHAARELGDALDEIHAARELGEALDEIHAARELGEALDESGVAEEIGEALASPPVLSPLSVIRVRCWAASVLSQHNQTMRAPNLHGKNTCLTIRQHRTCPNSPERLHGRGE